MPYDKNELLALPVEEKVSLAEELWSSVEDELLSITDEEIDFAEKRLKMHESNPSEGISLKDFKKYFKDKYGL